jgi:hypothetical protein
MSFEPWQFQYVPPPTVATPAGIVTPPQEVAPAVTKPTSKGYTQAGQFAQQLQDLRDTNQYLQQVVLNRCSKVTVTLNTNDPTVAQALNTIYGQTPPSAITAQMYSNLLDAQFTAMQTDMALAGTDLQLNKFEQGAVATLVSAVQDSMVDSGDFDTALPLLLQNLKGDDMVFSNMQTALQTYPAYMTAGQAPPDPGSPAPPITMSNIDVGPDTAQVLSTGLAGFPPVYASIYQLATTTSQVVADTQRVLALYVMQPLAMVLQMVALYKGMMAMMHKPRLKGLLKGLTAMVFVMLMAQFAGMVMLLDKFIQAVIAPLMQMVGVIMQMLSTVQGVTNSINRSVHALSGAAKATKAAFTSGGLEGMSQAYTCNMPHNAGMNKPPSAFAVQNVKIPGFGALNQGLLSMITHIQWGLTWIFKKQKQYLEKLNKLLKRRLMDTGAMIDLLCSMREINGLISLANAATAMITGKVNPGLNAAPGISGAATALAGGMTNTSIAGSIASNIPAPPPPTTVAVSVLNAGGVNPPISATPTNYAT